MHCHIDEHLNRGMAIAVGENSKCASTPPAAPSNETEDFCFSVETFAQKEKASCPHQQQPQPQLQHQLQGVPHLDTFRPSVLHPFLCKCLFFVYGLL